ncbi:MAG: oligosaccharide flippase family protein [Candidatus Sericytochromatia bacterium]|nr:oligosaccharide flippase family protein [Candidatus Sericytochromatia bacterium]
MASNLAQRALVGLRWTAAAQVGAQAAQWVAFVTLARAVTPEAYGTIASALLITGALGAAAELGLAPALLQLPILRPAHLGAGLVAAATSALLLTACCWAAAPALAAFFGQPMLVEVLRTLAWALPVASLGLVPRAVLERGLRFRALSAIETAAAVLGAAMVALAATRGWGVWAMVAGQLCSAATATVLVWLVARPSLASPLARGTWQDLLPVAAPVLGSRLLGFTASHLDTLLVGSLLGPAALGVYSLAHKLAMWPALRISHVVLRVAGPVLMRSREHHGAFSRGYVRLLRGLAALVLPLLGVLAALAPLAVPRLLGASWAEAAALTQLLCLVGASKALVCSVGVVYLGCGRPDLELKLNAVGALKLPALLALATPWGLPGVGCAYVLSSAIGAPVQLHLALRLLGVSWHSLATALARPAAGALAATAAAAGVLGATIAWEDTARLLAATLAGVAAGASAWAPAGWQALRQHRLQRAGSPEAVLTPPLDATGTS